MYYSNICICMYIFVLYYIFVYICICIPIQILCVHVRICAFTQSKQNNKISTIINFLPFPYSSSNWLVLLFFSYGSFFFLYTLRISYMYPVKYEHLPPVSFLQLPLQPLQHPSTSVSRFLFLCLILLIRS